MMFPERRIGGRFAGDGVLAAVAILAGIGKNTRARLLGGIFSKLTEEFSSLWWKALCDAVVGGRISPERPERWRHKLNAVSDYTVNFLIGSRVTHL